MKFIKIVGGGLFGLTLGRLLHDNNIPYTIYEKLDRVGGMVRTDRDEYGNEIHSHGAHIFHTDYDEVIEFITRFSGFTSYRHRVKCLVNYLGKNKLVELPLSYKTLADLYGTYDTTKLDFTLGQSESRMRIGNEVLDNLISNSSWDMYEMILKPYTENQWGMGIEKVPGFILDRIKFKKEFTVGYFKDKFQGIPELGYDGLIENLSNGLNIELGWKGYLSDFDKNDTVVWSGSIDKCLEGLELLPYRSLAFINRVGDDWEDPSIPVINTPNEKYTRKINHSLFRNDSRATENIISYEYPLEWNPEITRYYPIGTEENKLKYNKLKSSIIGEYPNVLFGGRLGEYTYYDMDDTIMSAINLSKKFING